MPTVARIRVPEKGNAGERRHGINALPIHDFRNNDVVMTPDPVLAASCASAAAT